MALKLPVFVIAGEKRDGGTVSSAAIVPYPPGIPILMPRERLQTEHVGLFRKLELFGRLFPGFEPGLHGIQRDSNGNFNLRLLTGEGAELLAEAIEGPEAQRLRARYRTSGGTGR